MTRVLAYLTVLFLNVAAAAQSDEAAVKNTITQLFDGMRKSDGNMIRNAFADGAILQTIVITKEGETRVRTENVDSFAIQVSRPHDEVYDERISFASIKIDGALASVWTPYQFYVGDRFSHCGVNSFQLVKFRGTWKIQFLIDTRRREKCD